MNCFGTEYNFKTHFHAVSNRFDNLLSVDHPCTHIPGSYPAEVILLLQEPTNLVCLLAVLSAVADEYPFGHIRNLIRLMLIPHRIRVNRGVNRGWIIISFLHSFQ